ncbi:DUF4282 domain-containing protein [Pseudonocardia asaccharolytica]|uniref:DUF4282 domain-containing protein n=1 Tax=Pseudonocardia asaccharolytica DSM 44247 = NBRC 16224 TaxID=1123024 RepID=A0A511CUZ9_9PSEU|nr:DUF4282 domain-containing protein [Pseudonocardia asaccharolytica]GEL16392.1 hypothetical protein PA7_02290 [Pseudonocardia asaccharolytica DSM 44247 = NBRC 16224]
MTHDPASPDDRSQPGGGWQQPYPGGYGQQPPPGWGPGGPGGPPAGYGGPTGPSGFGNPQDQARGFFTALFDFGFNRFATPAVVKVVYIIGTVVLTLAYLAAIVTGFLDSFGLGLLAILGGALVYLFYLTLFRITLEFYYAVVRMSEDIHHRR